MSAADQKMLDDAMALLLRVRASVEEIRERIEALEAKAAA